MEQNPFLDWYQTFQNQSEYFFSTANSYLKKFIDEGVAFKPQENLEEVENWLKELKRQWESMTLSKDQLNYQFYWQLLGQMCQEAQTQLLKKWIKRNQSEQPVKDLRDLYELWLESCHDVFQQAMRTAEYQEAYGKFMNAAFKLWQSYIPD